MSKEKVEEDNDMREEEDAFPLTREMAEARLIDAMGDLIWILVIAIVADVILALIGVDMGVTDAVSSIFGWIVVLILGLGTLRLIRRELDKK